MFTQRPDTMRLRNNLVPAITIFCLMCVSGAWNKAVAQAHSQPTAQSQAGSDSEIEGGPLKPEELVVPSNAALTSLSPPIVTDSASHSPNHPIDTTQGKGHKVQQQGKSAAFVTRAASATFGLPATILDAHHHLLTPP